MTAGIEEHNWAKANEKYKDVQNAIVSGKLFELYADCQRLVPADIKPVADKVQLEIEPFDPEKMGIGAKRAASSKRKREETDNLDLFTAGFQKASQLKKVNGAAGSKQVKANRNLPDELLEFPLGDLGSAYATSAEKDVLARVKQQPSVQAAQPARARNVAFPRPLSKTASGLSDNMQQKRSFSSSTRREVVTNILKQGAEHAANAKLFEKWENKLRSDLRWEDVHKWKYTDAGSDYAGLGKDKSFRSSSFRIPEEDRQSPLSSFRPASASNANSNIEGADLLFSDEDLPANAGNSLDDASDEELPDLSAVMRGAKIAKTTEAPVVPRVASPQPETGALAKQAVAPPLFREKSESPVSKPLSKVSKAVHPALPQVIEIDSDEEEDPSVMLVDKPSITK